jgi:hypothetical protein
VIKAVLGAVRDKQDRHGEDLARRAGGERHRMLKRVSMVAVLCLGTGAGQYAGAGDAAATFPRWTLRLADRCPTSPANLPAAPGVYPLEACTDAPEVWTYGLQPTQRGWVVYTSYGLEAFDEDGRVRWRVDNRSNCWKYYGELECAPLVTDFVATPDGGAWQMEDNSFPETSYEPDLLRRIRPDGSLGEAFELGSLARSSGARYRMAADGADGVALFWSQWQTGWLRIGQLRLKETTPPLVSEIPLPSDALPEIEAVRILPDGDALLVFTPNAIFRYCWTCHEPQRLAAARTSATGELIWRRDSDVVPAYRYTLSDDAVWVGNERAPFTLQQIDTAGIASGPFVHAGFGVDELPELASGSTGDVLFLTRTGLQRRSGNGVLLAQTPWEAEGTAIQRQPPAPTVAWPGTSAAVPDVLVLDPHSLLPTLRGFLLDRRPNGPVLPYVIAGDGGSHAVLRMGADPTLGLIAELARFDVPGSVAAGRIHRSGFEP